MCVWAFSTRRSEGRSVRLHGGCSPETFSMDFLLTPDVAYVVLMLALGLAVAAVIVPGTGLLEVGALCLFLLSGYQVLQMPVNLWALVVIVLGIFPLAYSLSRKRGRVAAGGALLLIFLGAAMLFRSPAGNVFGVHLPVVLVTTLMEGGFLWFVLIKSLEVIARLPRHDLSALVGLYGEARTPVYHDGSVYVNGELWSARSERPIPAGARVRVTGREGFCLLVHPVEERPG